MKKNSLFIAACTLLFASCSQDAVEEVVNSSASSTNQIGFLSSTSRASVITLDELQGDEVGFVVYGIKSDGDGEWDTEMNGSNYYTHVSGDWAWSETTPEWPDVDTESTAYPINFYAIYYLAESSGVTVVNTSEDLLAITYAAPTDGQVDILTASTSTDTRPSGDKLPLTFNHILSKVECQVTTGDDYVVYAQSVGFNNICSKRSYLVASSAWDSQDMSSTNLYPYMTTQTEAINTSEDDLVASYGTLMLLPQESTSWQPTDEDVENLDGSYIYFIYRATDLNGGDIFGYTDAASHPDYDPDTDSNYNDTPLFVKVGYPLGTSSFIIEAGKSYLYDINIGTTDATNGYLIADNYYDMYGNETDFDVKSKEIGDPLTDGYINFEVYVNDWEGSTSTTIE